MPQPRTITPFMAARPGVDQRMLRDVGLTADGNPLDSEDPRLHRRAAGRPIVSRALDLLKVLGTPPQSPARASSRV